MKAHRPGFTTQAILIISALLLIANGVLGITLMHQSQEAMVTQIQARMMDIATTAASMLDGDELEKLTAEDENTKPYQDALATLAVFQTIDELRYIYGIRDMGDGTFTFTVDPTVLDPGEFGEPIAYTDALDAASKGIPSVDKVPYSDKWGTFYSAYCPVFNSAGKVAGIVAVDFDAAWYEHQLTSITRTIISSSVFSLFVGALVVFVATSQMRKRLNTLYDQLALLGEDMKDLMEESGVRETSQGDSDQSTPAMASRTPIVSDSSIGTLSDTIRATHQELREYIDFVRKQAYTDVSTGVGNKTAYQRTVTRLESCIEEGSTSFSVVVFDVTGLKRINDELGHDVGDYVLEDTAMLISRVFGLENTYRIGGDEFIVTLEGLSKEELEALMSLMDTAVRTFNQGERRYEPELIISKGFARFEPGDSTSYNDVFRQADEAMYRDKAAYYIKHDRRRRRR